MHVKEPRSCEVGRVVWVASLFLAWRVRVAYFFSIMHCDILHFTKHPEARVSRAGARTRLQLQGYGDIQGFDSSSLAKQDAAWAAGAARAGTQARKGRHRRPRTRGDRTQNLVAQRPGTKPLSYFGRGGRPAPKRTSAQGESNQQPWGPKPRQLAHQAFLH